MSDVPITGVLWYDQREQAELDTGQDCCPVPDGQEQSRTGRAGL